MSGNSYIEHAESYQPLINMRIQMKAFERAGEISHIVLTGSPNDGVEPDTRVIELAYHLVNPDNHMGKQSERNAVNALLHAATIIVAEQEMERGKPLSGAQLGEMMLVVMPELAQSKYKLQELARDANRNTPQQR